MRGKRFGGRTTRLNQEDRSETDASLVGLVGLDIIRQPLVAEAVTENDAKGARFQRIHIGEMPIGTLRHEEAGFGISQQGAQDVAERLGFFLTHPKRPID